MLAPAIPRQNADFLFAGSLSFAICFWRRSLTHSAAQEQSAAAQTSSEKQSQCRRFGNDQSNASTPRLRGADIVHFGEAQAQGLSRIGGQHTGDIGIYESVARRERIACLRLEQREQNVPACHAERIRTGKQQVYAGLLVIRAAEIQRTGREEISRLIADEDLRNSAGHRSDQPARQSLDTKRGNPRLRPPTWPRYCPPAARKPDCRTEAIRFRSAHKNSLRSPSDPDSSSSQNRESLRRCYPRIHH